MFRDQKNINIRVLSWLLLAIFASNMHYLCYFIHLDVMHLPKQINLSFFNWHYTIINPFRDVFFFYDAPDKIHLDIEWYLYILGFRLNAIIAYYLLQSAILGLRTWQKITIPTLDVHQRTHKYVKVYLVVQLYNLLSYVLFYGQFFHGLPLLVYVGMLFVIFFIKKTDQGYVIKPEL